MYSLSALSFLNFFTQKFKVLPYFWFEFAHSMMAHYSQSSYKVRFYQATTVLFALMALGGLRGTANQQPLSKKAHKKIQSSINHRKQAVAIDQVAHNQAKPAIYKVESKIEEARLDKDTIRLVALQDTLIYMQRNVIVRLERINENQDSIIQQQDTLLSSFKAGTVIKERNLRSRAGALVASISMNIAQAVMLIRLTFAQ